MQTGIVAIVAAMQALVIFLTQVFVNVSHIDSSVFVFGFSGSREFNNEGWRTAQSLAPRGELVGRGKSCGQVFHTFIPTMRKSRKPTKNTAVIKGVSGCSWASTSSSSVTR